VADVLLIPGHLVLPAFPLCIGRHLQTGQSSGPSFYVALADTDTVANARPFGRALHVERYFQDQADARISRRRALCWKKSAWLITAETFAGWNGLAIRKAGSGRSPVRKRSG
jgi:hypothetical protein